MPTKKEIVKDAVGKKAITSMPLNAPKTLPPKLMSQKPAYHKGLRDSLNTATSPRGLSSLSATTSTTTQSSPDRKALLSKMIRATKRRDDSKGAAKMISPFSLIGKGASKIGSAVVKGLGGAAVKGLKGLKGAANGAMDAILNPNIVAENKLKEDIEKGKRNPDGSPIF